MTEPHPLRCETCNFKRTLKCPAFKREILEESMDYNNANYYVDENFIECCGCASHSNATSAEKVPDGFILALNLTKEEREVVSQAYDIFQKAKLREREQ